MDTVKYHVHKEGYVEIKLNRPEKRNAISGEMRTDLKEAIQRAKQEPISCLVITGTGDEVFCAGGDLKELHGDLTTEEAFSQLYEMKEVLYEIAAFPVPTICLLNGNALGGGCELAAACDVRIAKDTATFGFVQTKLGITPGWGGGVLLYESVHASFAFHWLMAAEIYDARYLQEQGFIHKVVEKADWNNHEKLLEPYVTKSFEQMKLIKRQYLKKISILSLSSLMDEEVRVCANLWESPAHKKAVGKFLARK
ncbi:enoyl-CoA hydratase/isomerase family protein [Lentibacillus sp. Marseille-P4043]|uniref:enoyl-CoA hydratase/isomerase family protein n=1 Tax=Lentibacillus sp. Marseille-P4043 TaxID=2040293 RepID=UPI001F2F52CE|nr:enoyl-CoA hydratase/isomerase family protein [Lentibacillus sp. Marseille-P4043]